MFCGIIVVFEGEWFYDMNLTDGATFPTALSKYAKTRVNQKKNRVTQKDTYGKFQ